jgi:predicted transcriptional regulator
VLEVAVESETDYLVTHNLKDFVEAGRFWDSGSYTKGISYGNRSSEMSTLSLRIPDSLHERIREIAKRENISINQFVNSAVAEKLSALLTEEYLEERSKRGSRRRFKKALSKVKDVEPEKHDKL